MPPPIMPGADQLARSPLPPTWYVPRMTAYSRPPRAISNDVTESKNDVPSRVVTNMPARVVQVGVEVLVGSRTRRS